MNTIPHRSPVDYIVKGLQTAASELVELKLQIALGKVEAKDLFENMKKSLQIRIEQMKSKFRVAKNSEGVLPVLNALEHLQVQLTLGIAETKEAFDKQRKNIEHSLSQLENKLKLGAPGRQVAKIQLEIEKFKAKLQLLSLGYKLTKIYLHYNLKQKKEEFAQTLREIKTKLEQKEERAKNKWQNYKDEIQEAFGDLKSAFVPFD